MVGKLNTDIAKSVAEFDSLINRVLPKRIFFKLILRGKGLEFDSYRAFAPDEDASSIDWKASVRGNTLLAKQFIEERDYKIVFIIDVGENMVFGSTEKLKCEYVAEMAAAMADVMIKATDKIGFVFYKEEIVRAVNILPGKKQFDFFVYNLTDPTLYGGKSDISKCIDNVLEFLNPTITLVVLISDFIKIDEGSFKKFEELGNMYETISIMVRDPLDLELPNLNKEVVIQDIDSGQKLLINPKIAKRIYELNVQKQLEVVRNLFKKI